MKAWCCIVCNSKLSKLYDPTINGSSIRLYFSGDETLLSSLCWPTPSYTYQYCWSSTELKNLILCQEQCFICKWNSCHKFAIERLFIFSKCNYILNTPHIILGADVMTNNEWNPRCLSTYFIAIKEDVN